jgi:peptidyl-prolyl cis-trans isomerase C
MSKMKNLCVILFIGVLLVTACKKGEEKEGKILAKVGKSTLTMEDFLQQIPPQMLMQTTAENRQAILDNWVANEIIYEDALKKGLSKDPEIEERLEQIKKQLLTRAYMQEILEEVQFVSDIEARSYFEQYKDEFNSIREVSHMSFNSKAEAEEVHAQLKKGASFYQLAQKHSTDTETAQNGGRLGSFRKGELTASYPLFEEAVFSIEKAGEFSDVVQTEFNYDIIKLHSIKKSPVEYEDVAQSIMLKIRTEKFQQRSEALVDSLKEVYSYEIYPEVLEKELGIPSLGAPGLPTPTE